MFRDRVLPAKYTEPRKLFTQNVFLELQLLRCRDVLVVAAAAFLEMSALCISALFRRCSDLQQFGPDQFLLFRFRVRAYLFPGQNKRHENGIFISVRPSVTALNELLNR